ncbi:MAG: UDP-galactopyranose mutase [bacterium]
MIPKRFLVVGAGFAGAVCARFLADTGHAVHIIDRRDHLGGNAHDPTDPHGIRIHTYGPHIFHTSSQPVFDFLSRFTDWRFYEHRVRAVVNGMLVPIPVNRTTINCLYNLDLQATDVPAYLAHVRHPRRQLLTSEDVVLDTVGPDLCEKLFRGYTRKLWGMDLSDLSASVLARIPVRHNDDDRYFTDTHQFMPAQGYTAMFHRMLGHAGITVTLGCDFRELRAQSRDAHVIYTGSIDEYFDHCLGRLPYRSLRFEHAHLSDTAYFQPVGTVNYPNDHAFTRITEFKHLTGETHAGTSIMREYPQSTGTPYYPIPRPENAALYARYAALAEQQRGVSFVGRLAQYRYDNMDQIAAAALQTAQHLAGALP